MIKTFKIGEETIGGIVQVSTRPRGVFEVKSIDTRTKLVLMWRYVYGLDELQEYLEEISTVYWADKFVQHFKRKIGATQE